MIEINLLPDVKRELIKAQRTRSKVVTFAIIVSVVSIAIVVILAIYVFAVQSVRSNMATTAIDEGSAKLSGVQDLPKTLTIQNQLTKLAALNANKKIDSRIFDILVAIIPPVPNNVQISNLTVDSQSGTITIEGQAQNSYAAVEVFKKTIGDTMLKYTDVSNQQQSINLASNISTNNTSYGEDASGNKVLRFTLSFNYALEAFSPDSKSLTLSVANGGNATDSYLGIPNIFVDKATDIPAGGQ